MNHNILVIPATDINNVNTPETITIITTIPTSPTIPPTLLPKILLPLHLPPSLASNSTKKVIAEKVIIVLTNPVINIPKYIKSLHHSLQLQEVLYLPFQEVFNLQEVISLLLQEVSLYKIINILKIYFK
jgi:hypothetical protein